MYQFYSSQAQVMLAQYRNINDLLGPTTDWTAPGTLCEVFIRDLIRRTLPGRYSIDKGFIFGRRRKGTEEVHSPEIDLLVHDTQEYAPVYRLEDFVIVRPQAVRAVIQVKRTLDGGKLKDAIVNLVDAKEHLRAFNALTIPGGGEVFAAAFFFGDKLNLEDGGISTTYSTTIRAMQADKWTRPHFLGSLVNRFYVVPLREDNSRYEGYPSSDTRGNLALVMFLAYLTQYVIPNGFQPTFFRPGSLVTDETITLVEGGEQPEASQATDTPVT